MGAAARILVDGEQSGDTATLFVDAAHEMTRPLWCHHEDIDVWRGHDLAEVNIEPMCERERIAFLQIGFDIRFVHGALNLVVDENHDDVARLGGLGDCRRLETCLLCLGAPRTAFAQADDDLDTAFL